MAIFCIRENTLNPALVRDPPAPARRTHPATQYPTPEAQPFSLSLDSTYIPVPSPTPHSYRGTTAPGIGGIRRFCYSSVIIARSRIIDSCTKSTESGSCGPFPVTFPRHERLPSVRQWEKLLCTMTPVPLNPVRYISFNTLASHSHPHQRIRPESPTLSRRSYRLCSTSIWDGSRSLVWRFSLEQTVYSPLLRWT